MSEMNSGSNWDIVEFALLDVPEMPPAASRSDPNSARSRALVDAIFNKWTEMG